MFFRELLIPHIVASAILTIGSAAGWVVSIYRRRRDKAAMKTKVQKIIAKITADGKIIGPKGRYTPLSSRRRVGTSHSPRNNGYWGKG